jgi:hypothetical protein
MKQFENAKRNPKQLPGYTVKEETNIAVYQKM